MASVVASCPFCNAPLEPLATPPRGLRPPCPRCGEPVPLERWPIALADAGQPGIPVATPGKRKTLFAMLGVMVVMAVVGLSYALLTQDTRMKRHPHAPDTLPPIAMRRPGTLPALGYLPAGAGVVAGLHIAEIVQDPEGKKLLAEPFPLLDHVLTPLRAAGLTREDLDHAVVAVTENPALQLWVIVKTRRPYNLERLSQAVQPARGLRFREHAAFEFKLGTLGDSILYCADPQTLIIYSQPLGAPRLEDLQALPDTPRPLTETLSEPLRQMLADRVPQHSIAWLIGDQERLPTLQAFLPLAAGMAPIADMKRVAGGVLLQEGVTVLGHVYTGDAKASRRVADYLEGRGIRNLRVTTAPEQAPADAPWVTAQWRSDIEALRNSLTARK